MKKQTNLNGIDVTLEIVVEDDVYLKLTVMVDKNTGVEFDHITQRKDIVGILSALELKETDLLNRFIGIGFTLCEYYYVDGKKSLPEGTVYDSINIDQRKEFFANFPISETDFGMFADGLLQFINQSGYLHYLPVNC